MTNETASEKAEEPRKMVDFCLSKARDLLTQERTLEARALVNLAAQLDLDAVRIAYRDGDPAMRTLTAQCIILFGLRGQQLGHPCAILGRAETSLDPRREALIRAIFDEHQRGFETGAVPEPQFTGIYGGAPDRPAAPSRAVRIFMILARHINANPLYVESDVFHHFTQSAEAAGLTTRVFDADLLTYDIRLRFPYSDALIIASRRALEAELEQFRPDVILFDGNFTPTGRTLDAAWLGAVRRKYGCRVATILPDCYDPSPNLYATWADVSDAMILFNRETTHPVRSGMPEKAFYACGLPFDERLFATTEEGKSDDMIIIGSDRRSRGDLAAMLRAHGVPINAHLHNRSTQSAPSTEEYSALLRAAKMTFNTGRVEETQGLSIVTGRCFEAILSRTVLLEEAGSGLDDYFLPFVHYVPYANVAQLVMFSQFLLMNDDYRRRIAEQAFSWHKGRFRSDQFWAALLTRLGLN